MTQKQTIVFGKQCWPVSPGLYVSFLTLGKGRGYSIGTGTSVIIPTHFNYQMLSDICAGFFKVDNLYTDNLS